jgi:hypothetical protein
MVELLAAGIVSGVVAGVSAVITILVIDKINERKK